MMTKQQLNSTALPVLHLVDMGEIVPADPPISEAARAAIEARQALRTVVIGARDAATWDGYECFIVGRVQAVRQWARDLGEELRDADALAAAWDAWLCRAYMEIEREKLERAA